MSNTNTIKLLDGATSVGPGQEFDLRSSTFQYTAILDGLNGSATLEVSYDGSYWYQINQLDLTGSGHRIVNTPNSLATTGSYPPVFNKIRANVTAYTSGSANLYFAWI